MQRFEIPGGTSGLRKCRREFPRGPWEKISFEYKQELKQIFLENQSPHGQPLCAYCEAQISSQKSHIDHVDPKGDPQFAHLTFCVENLVASCGKTNSQTCGHHKDSQVLPEWSKPYARQNAAERFRYDLDGAIVGSDDEAEEVVNMLNLNEKTLKQRRMQRINEILSMQRSLGSDAALLKMHLRDFPSLVDYLVG